MSETNALTADGLPDTFWHVSEAFIGDENLRFLHADACARLRQESPEADTLELMAIERITSLWCYMRFKEGTGQFSSDTAYKGMMQLWTVMAADLRKARLGEADVHRVREEVMRTVIGAVNSALHGMEPETAATMKRRIAERLEKV